jgi:hypothetical protein
VFRKLQVANQQEHFDHGQQMLLFETVHAKPLQHYNLHNALEQKDLLNFIVLSLLKQCVVKHVVIP